MINCYGSKIAKMCSTLYSYCVNICNNYYEYDDDASKDCFCNCSTNLNRYNELCVTYNEFEFSKMATALTICLVAFIFMLIVCRVCITRKLQLQVFENRQGTDLNRLTNLPNYNELDSTVIIQSNQVIPLQEPPQYNENQAMDDLPPSYNTQLGKTI